MTADPIFTLNSERMARLGSAVRGTVPFYKDEDGQLVFDNSKGRIVMYGQQFDRRGYRPCFWFESCPAARNSIDPADLKRWAAGIKPEDDGQREFKRIAIRLADQCLSLTRAWQAQGKPEGGLVLYEGGTA